MSQMSEYLEGEKTENVRQDGTFLAGEAATTNQLFTESMSTYFNLFRYLCNTKVPVCGQDEVQKGVWIGSGHTMTVYKGRWKDRDVAVKYVLPWPEFKGQIVDGLTITYAGT